MRSSVLSVLSVAAVAVADYNAAPPPTYPVEAPPTYPVEAPPNTTPEPTPVISLAPPVYFSSEPVHTPEAVVSLAPPVYFSSEPVHTPEAVVSLAPPVYFSSEPVHTPEAVVSLAPPVYFSSKPPTYDVPAVSTVYETREYTISSCPPTVTNCPYGQKTNYVVTHTPEAPAAPPAGVPTVPAEHPPVAYPTGGAGGGNEAPYPSYPATKIEKPYSSGYPTGSAPPAGNTTVTFSSGAVAKSASGLLMAAGIFAALF